MTSDLASPFSAIKSAVYPRNGILSELTANVADDTLILSNFSISPGNKV